MQPEMAATGCVLIQDGWEDDVHLDRKDRPCLECSIAWTSIIFGHGLIVLMPVCFNVLVE